MKRVVFMILVLIGLLKAEPTKADFGLTASIIGLGAGAGLVVAAPFLDKKNQDEEIGKGKPTCSECENEDEKAGVDQEEFFNLDLSKATLEDLKLKAVGRRGG